MNEPQQSFKLMNMFVFSFLIATLILPISTGQDLDTHNTSINITTYTISWTNVSVNFTNNYTWSTTLEPNINHRKKQNNPYPFFDDITFIDGGGIHNILKNIATKLSFPIKLILEIILLSAFFYPLYTFVLESNKHPKIRKICLPILFICFLPITLLLQVCGLGIGRLIILPVYNIIKLCLTKSCHCICCYKKNSINTNRCNRCNMCIKDYFSEIKNSFLGRNTIYWKINTNICFRSMIICFIYYINFDDNNTNNNNGIIQSICYIFWILGFYIWCFGQLIFWCLMSIVLIFILPKLMYDKCKNDKILILFFLTCPIIVGLIFVWPILGELELDHYIYNNSNNSDDNKDDDSIRGGDIFFQILFGEMSILWYIWSIIGFIEFFIIYPIEKYNKWKNVKNERSDSNVESRIRNSHYGYGNSNDKELLLFSNKFEEGIDINNNNNNNNINIHHDDDEDNSISIPDYEFMAAPKYEPPKYNSPKQAKEAKEKKAKAKAKVEKGGIFSGPKKLNNLIRGKKESGKYNKNSNETGIDSIKGELSMSLSKTNYGETQMTNMKLK